MDQVCYACILAVEVDGVSESKNGADSDLLLSSAKNCIHDDSFCGVVPSWSFLENSFEPINTKHERIDR